MSDARAFYGQWARLYDLIARRLPGVHRIRRQTVNALRLEPGDTVVEMGCGTGANLPLLREAVGPEGTVVGLDFTRGVLDQARWTVSEGRQVDGSPVVPESVHLVHGDATAPPLDGPVDGVLATFVVGMLDDPAVAVDHWWNLLADGGHLVLLNAASSDHWTSPLLDPLFRAAVVLSTPPTTRLRYERDLVAELDGRVQQAHDRLETSADAVAVDSHWFDLLTLTGGRRD